MSRKKPAGALPEGVPSTARTEAPEAPRKGNGGAPKGNVNRASDGVFTLRMRLARKQAKRAAATRRRKHEAEANAILAALGYADDPMRPYLLRDLADNAREREELYRIVERVSRTDRTGALSSAYERFLSAIERGFTLHKTMIDSLTAREAARPVETKLARIIFQAVDGQEITPKTGSEPIAERQRMMPTYQTTVDEPDAPVRGAVAFEPPAADEPESPEAGAARERATRRRAPVPAPAAAPVAAFVGGPGGFITPSLPSRPAVDEFFKRDGDISTMDF